MSGKALAIALLLLHYPAHRQTRDAQATPLAHLNRASSLASSETALNAVKLSLVINLRLIVLKRRTFVPVISHSSESRIDFDASSLPMRLPRITSVLALCWTDMRWVPPPFADAS